jgi:colicin import membrane protein
MPLTHTSYAQLLAEALNINKGKARALVQEAREALMKRGDYFARSEDAMRDKLVACASTLEKERGQRKQEKGASGGEKGGEREVQKAQQKEKEKQVQEQKKKQEEQRRQAEAEAEKEEEGSDEDGESEGSEQESEDEGDADFDPYKNLTPDQKTAALQKERTQAAQREVASRQMRSAFEQKKRQPAYIRYVTLFLYNTY